MIQVGDIFMSQILVISHTCFTYGGIIVASLFKQKKTSHQPYIITNQYIPFSNNAFDQLFFNVLQFFTFRFFKVPHKNKVNPVFFKGLPVTSVYVFGFSHTFYYGCTLQIIYNCQQHESEWLYLNLNQNKSPYAHVKCIWWEINK